jgi:hypothetical protein
LGDDVFGGLDGKEKRGSTARVQQELEQVQRECSAISKNISLLGDIIY